MRAPQERTVRDLYDRTRHKDPAAPEDKTIVRKRLLSNDNIHVKAESGTCNVCYAPCSSCLHRSLGHADSNIDCESSQTCSTRSEIKHSSLLRTEKGVCSRGENGDEFSAASNNGSYSETVGNKVGSRLSIAEDSSEVDMPAKRRRLSKDDMKLSRAECRDDKNSCITGMAAEGKHLHKKRLPTSASSRDLTIKECKDNSVASNSRLRKLHADESTEKHRSDVMHPSSSVMAKRLLRTQSSISASKGFSPRRQAHEFGDTQQNVSCQLSEKASLSNIIKEEPLDGTSNPCVDAGDNNDLLTGCNASMRNEKKAELTPKDFGNNTSCSEDQIQEQAVVQTNDDVKKTGVVKKDQDQDSSMDISSEGVLNMQNDVMTDCGNSEGLIDVNVCDICGDVGREYLLATCTRCLEGAEHTYCMLVKLDKVPDGEWLCEECKLKDDSSKTRFQNGGQKVDISEGKNQSSDNQNNPKALRVVVPNFDAPRVNCTTADQCDAKNKKLHLAAADTQLRQANVISPVAEGLEVKNNKLLSMANRKKLQVITSDLEARSRTSGVQTPSSSNKKNQSSEVCSNHKKLRVSTDLETPLSSEGLRSPPTSCKRLAENTSSPNLRLFKANSLKKRDSCESSFKKSNEVSISSLDNASVRNGQTVKSSQTLSRSYSMGSMVNAKAPVPSPRGHLSKQRSFNSSNNGPKVKQLSEGARSKLRPVKHSPKDLRDQGPIKKIMRSDSFKFEGSVCKDAGSPKQKQSFHLSQDEKPVILKSMKEKNMMERRASFSFKKPNIPSSPRHESSVKPGERKLYQGISRPGPSILKSSKKPGNAEKESTDLSKSGKREISVHQKPIGFVSGKDIYAVNIPDPPVPSQCVKRDNSNDGEEDSFILVKNGNGMPTEPPEVLPATSDSMTLESDLRDIVPRVGALEGSASKVVGFEQKPLVGTINSSCRDIGVVQVSDDKLPVIPHGLQIINNRYSTDNKFDKSNLKQEAYLDQSITGNLSGNLVIPEQSYIWQGSFEVSRRGIPEVFDGIQAYLSTCASCKVREVGKQLPYKIQLAEVPRHSSWPLQFEEVNPTEDNIALFFFAKDAESYERAYGKLLEDMVLGDLCLIANIGGTELLIFPSDKLPERTQHWNGLLFFWGIFYARKASSLPVLPVTGTYNCPLGPITGPVIQHVECLPKALQSLGIDLNECPHDDLSDPAVSPKTSAAIDQNIWFKPKHEPKHEGKNLDSRETYHEETAGTRHIVSGHPTAAPCGIHFPRIPTEGHHMVKDYPNAAKDTSGIAGNGNVEEHAFCQPETLLCVAQQAGTGSSMSEEMVVKEQAYQPSVEASPCHFGGSKISDDSNHLVPKSGIVSSYSCYKRQKTSHGRHSSYSFEELPSKYLSKIHPTPAGQKNLFENVQYIYSGPSDPGSHKKLISDREVHVLSSDDEDSPVPSTSLNNKASRKADESSSPLLPLSLSTVATKHNIAGSDIEEAEPLSLSLGLPDVVGGNPVLEMKQFLPEKPGINT